MCPIVSYELLLLENPFVVSFRTTNTMENIQRQLLGEIWENAQGANENFEIEMDDEDDRDADGTLDGGVAMPDGGGSNSKRKSSDCDLVRSVDFCRNCMRLLSTHLCFFARFFICPVRKSWTLLLRTPFYGQVWWYRLD